MRIFREPVVCGAEFGDGRARDFVEELSAWGNRELLARIEQFDTRRLAPRHRRANREVDCLLVLLAASGDGEDDVHLAGHGWRVRVEPEDGSLVLREPD